MTFDAIENRTWIVSYGALNDPDLPDYVRVLRDRGQFLRVAPITVSGAAAGEPFWLSATTISHLKPLELLVGDDRDE